MADLVARALGRAALRNVQPQRRITVLEEVRTSALRQMGEKGFAPCMELPDLHTSIEEMACQIRDEAYRACFEDMTLVIQMYFPELCVDGKSLREQLDKLARSDSQLSRLRLKYGWHKCSEVLPNHSRHVLVWTNRGEYRAWYDHKWKCWRLRRDGLTVTHWREQCGPENWPVK